MTDVVIVSAARTPVGSFNGAFGALSAHELGAVEMVKAINPEIVAKNILPQIPVGRLGEPHEIARTVVFLASDDAGFITGSTISANGGQSMI